MNLNKEDDLYEPVRNWLEDFLLENLQASFVKTYIGANESLSKILSREDFGPQIKDLDFFGFKIDVFGVVKIRQSLRLIIIECKKDSIGLVHLGQLLGYSQIIMPWRSILLSPHGVNSSLNKFITIHKMDHLLRYGQDGKISICKWDIDKRRPDFSRVLPTGSMDPISFF